MSTCKNPEAAASNHSLKFIILSMNSQFLEYFESPMNAVATWEHFLHMNILTSSAWSQFDFRADISFAVMNTPMIWIW